MSGELKPCPFCGKDLAINRRKHNPYARCATENCKGGRLPLLNLDQPEDVAAWNTRATLSPAHIEDREEVEVAGYSIEGRDEIGVVRIRRLADRPFPEHMQEARDWAGPFNVVSEPLMTVAQHQRIVAALSAPPAADMADAYVSARENLSIWKRRALEAEEKLRTYDQRIVDLGVLSLKTAVERKAPPAAGAPVNVTAVAITRQNEDGELYLNWFLEGGIAELECEGQVLLIADAEITGDEGDGVVYTAPTPPASEQQRAVDLDVIDKLRLELRPEYEAGYTAVAYVDSDQPVAWADGMTAREAIAELLRLNPHLAKGEGV